MTWMGKEKKMKNWHGWLEQNKNYKINFGDIKIKVWMDLEKEKSLTLTGTETHFRFGIDGQRKNILNLTYMWTTTKNSLV